MKVLDLISQCLVDFLFEVVDFIFDRAWLRWMLVLLFACFIAYSGFNLYCINRDGDEQIKRDDARFDKWINRINQRPLH